MTAASDAEIADWLSGRYGDIVLRPRFLRRTLAYDPLDDLTEAISSASIDLDNDRAILRTARFAILPENLPADFGEVDELVSVALVLTIPGRDDTTFDCGLFVLDYPEATAEPNYQRAWSNVQASDLGVLLQNYSKNEAHTVIGGSSYVAAAQAVISAAGLTSIINDPGFTTPNDMTWPPYTPGLTIVNDLMFAINFFPVWADMHGTFRSRERIDPSLDVARVHYTTLNEPRMIVGRQFRQRISRQNITNQFSVTVQDPNRAPISVVVANTDSNSIVSVPVTGRPVTKGLSGDRVADTATMLAIGDYEVKDAGIRCRTASLATLRDPRRGAHETYALTLEDQSSAQLWRVLKWSMDLKSDAVMDHTIVRADHIATTPTVIEDFGIVPPCYANASFEVNTVGWFTDPADAPDGITFLGGAGASIARQTGDPPPGYIGAGHLVQVGTTLFSTGVVQNVGCGGLYPNTTYEVSFWYKGDASALFASVGLPGTSPPYSNQLVALTNAADWRQIALQFTTGAITPPGPVYAGQVAVQSAADGTGSPFDIRIGGFRIVKV